MFLGIICFQKRSYRSQLLSWFHHHHLRLGNIYGKIFQPSLHQPCSFSDKPAPWQPAARARCLLVPRPGVSQTGAAWMDAARSLLPAALTPLPHPRSLPSQSAPAVMPSRRDAAERGKALPSALSLPPSHFQEATAWCNSKENVLLSHPAWQLAKSHSSSWRRLVFHLRRLRIKAGTATRRRQACLWWCPTLSCPAEEGTATAHKAPAPRRPRAHHACFSPGKRVSLQKHFSVAIFCVKVPKRGIWKPEAVLIEPFYPLLRENYCCT